MDEAISIPVPVCDELYGWEVAADPWAMMRPASAINWGAASRWKHHGLRTIIFHHYLVLVGCWHCLSTPLLTNMTSQHQQQLSTITTPHWPTIDIITIGRLSLTKLDFNHSLHCFSCWGQTYGWSGASQTAGASRSACPKRSKLSV